MENRIFKTVAELSERDINKATPLLDGCALHYNGPGSTGFGVKRTAMLMPETAMLMVAPMGCSRSGTVPAEEFGFSDRMFYLNIDDRSMASGAYLKKAREAARFIADTGEFKGLLICMTCLDALAGTDLAGFAKAVARETGLTVTGTFMDPIVRDGNFGPMVQVRKAITDCIVREEGAGSDPSANAAPAVNLLGVFAAPKRSCELYEALAPAGITEVKTVAGCKTLDELRAMSGSRLNIVVHPQALASAKDMERRLAIPYVKAMASYNIDTIDRQYAALSQTLGTALNAAARRNKALSAASDFRRDFEGSRIAVGEAIHGSTFDIARMLTEAGAAVPFVFKDIIRPDELDDIRRLAEIAPDIKVYSGVDPRTCTAPAELPEADIVLGLDAAYFCPRAVSIGWDYSQSHFGYDGVIRLTEMIRTGCTQPSGHKQQMRGSYLTV